MQHHASYGFLSLLTGKRSILNDIVDFIVDEKDRRSLGNTCTAMKREVSVVPLPSLLTVADHNEFYTQRNTLIYKVVVSLTQQARCQCDKEISEFMMNLRVFYTTTAPGARFLMLLLYPPTDCFRTLNTLGNQSGRELAAAGLNNVEVGVIEVCPLGAITKSQDFPQIRLQHLLKNNAFFRGQILNYIRDTLDVELHYSHKDNRHIPLYVGVTYSGICRLSL
jgi:hypothetical protein